ncbi:MAG: SusF/SusE family outer membrane protein [Pedobacter sp.]|nr:MAG: SusF/SusE family outer membrane protein [Pedobacter sp.]
MKSLILKSLAFGLITLSLWSCKKDEDQSVATSGTSGSLKSSTASVILDKTMLAKDVITFSLTNANFGYQAAVTNVLQLALKGTNFANPKETILPANATSKAYTGLDFNNLLLSLNLPTTTNSDVEIRVKSSISTNLPPVYSNVVALSAKPFPLTAWIYVPGAYQGWDPTKADSLVSLSGNGVYSGVIVFDGGNFKITPAKKWDIAYGMAGAGKISTSGGDISSLTAGAKQLDVDLNNLTYSLTPLVWSIIGNAIPGSNWSVDTDAKFINDGKGAWKVTLALTPGELKFRKNHDWGVSIGDASGNNITIATAGNYTLTAVINADGKTGTVTVVKN